MTSAMPVQRSFQLSYGVQKHNNPGAQVNRLKVENHWLLPPINITRLELNWHKSVESYKGQIHITAKESNTKTAKKEKIAHNSDCVEIQVLSLKDHC